MSSGSLLEHKPALSAGVLRAEECDPLDVRLGGKGQHLALLNQAGVPVPPFLVVASSVQQQAMAESAEQQRQLREGSGNSAELLRGLRSAAINCALSQQLCDDIRHFMLRHAQSHSHSAAASFAVRSSGLSEDTATAAFAGQYDTHLHCRTEQDVFDALRQCWASQFSDSVWSYARRLHFEEEVGMGVLVQLQIDSVVAGVCFSVDPTCDASAPSELLVEAALGQGEGVVSGRVAPDRWKVTRDQQLSVASFEPGRKPVRLMLDPNKRGLREEAVPEEQQTAPSLTPQQVAEVAKVTLQIEHFLGGAVDVEFAFDARGKLWILQGRRVTRRASGPVWTPPGKVCAFDPVHFPRPITRISQEPIHKGLSEGMRWSMVHVGALLRLIYHTVNDVIYEEFAHPAPEDMPRVFERSVEYFKSRQWEQDFKEWTEVTCPASVARHFELKRVEFAKLTDDQLLLHFDRVMQHWENSLFNHHKYTMSLATMQGYYLKHGAELSGAQDSELLAILQAASPGSRGIWQPDVVQELRAAFDADSAGRAILQTFSVEKCNGAAVLQELLERKDSKTAAFVQWWLDRFDHYILNGYDASEPTYGEDPDLIVRNFLSVVNADRSEHSDVVFQVRELRKAVTDRIADAEKKVAFQQLLDDVLRMSDWRDQRGLLNDIQASGLVRRCLHEIGNRILARDGKGRLMSWDFLLECSAAEVRGFMLAHDRLPSREELRRRRAWRLTGQGFPPVLGEAPHPPDFNALPPPVREVELCRAAFLMKLLPQAPPPESGDADSEVVVGHGANPGVVEGTARVLLDADSWQNLRVGDIAVVPSTGAAFNCVLPLLSGLVSDFGGVLSHAALCAREFGIPCVCSTFVATKRIPDGATIRVDGSLGKVTIVSRKNEKQ